ncbi:MAG: ABC transporter permease [Bacteroidota bacterium]
MTSRGQRPPGWVRKFLSNFLDDRVLEGSLGDLEEKYSNNVERGTHVWHANVIYIFEALGFMKVAALRKEEPRSIAGQVLHIFTFFARLVKRDKSYYLVSMFGLALSLASFLLIAMFIADELSYDSVHVNRDRIFRVTTHVRLNDVDFDLATTQFPAAHALQSEFPEIEEAVRLHATTMFIEVNDNKFEEKVAFVDDNFFNVFSFPLISGKHGDAIITERMALKYFGPDDPIGRIVKIGSREMRISGVMKDIDTHSHFKFDFFVPLSKQLDVWKSENGIEGRENKWFWIGAYTYVMLRDASDETPLREKLAAFVKKYFPERFRESRYELQKLTDIHLISHKDNELESNGDILYVQLFTVLAVVIIVVSFINIINLSHFKITSRSKEVGIRRSLGQSPGKVFLQLSVESLLSGIISFLIAIVLCIVFLPQFNQVVEKDLHLSMRLMGFTLALVVVVSLLAIARPTRKITSAGHTRNVLIGLQVCFSFVLLVFSFIIGSQIDFFGEKDLGFDKNNIVVIPMNDNFDQEAFKREIKRNTSVINASGGEPPGYGYDGWRFVPEGGPYEKPLMLSFTFADKEFMETMKMKLLAGRNFNKDDNSRIDTLWSFMINRKAAIELGWAEDPIGHTMEIFAPGRTEIMAKGRVVGLIEDYHSESLHDPVKPVVIACDVAGFGEFLVRVSDVNGETIAAIENTWNKFSNRPFEYFVLDQQLDRLYANEEKLGNVMLFFTLVALYLTCYGLFAMSSLVFTSKLKEVAIRKVFGAGEASILRQFYSRYALFNIIALIVGVPVAMWLGNLWLETFQYRIGLSVMFFAKAALLVLIAGMLSVSYYLAKVAWSNPLPFLRRD